MTWVPCIIIVLIFLFLGISRLLPIYFSCLQKIGSCRDLLKAVRLLCVSLWPEKVQRTSDLRLEIIIRMLKTPHFSARMNALKVSHLAIGTATCRSLNMQCSIILTFMCVADLTFFYFTGA